MTYGFQSPLPDIPALIERLRPLMAKVTKGPWAFDGPRHNVIIWGADEETRVCFMTSNGPSRENAALIVEAVNALPAMLDTLSTLSVETVRNEALEEAAKVADDAHSPGRSGSWRAACRHVSTTIRSLKSTPPALKETPS